MDLYDKIEVDAGKICFVNLSPDIRRVFELMGFMKYFGEASNYEDALKYV